MYHEPKILDWGLYDVRVLSIALSCFALSCPLSGYSMSWCSDAWECQYDGPIKMQKVCQYNHKAY